MVGETLTYEFWGRRHNSVHNTIILSVLYEKQIGKYANVVKNQDFSKREI
jgi:hypothetical protein